MNEKFICISLSSTMRRIHEPQMQLKELEKRKKTWEEKLTNPDKRKEHIEATLKNAHKEQDELLQEIEEINTKLKTLSEKTRLDYDESKEFESLTRQLKFKKDLLENANDSVKSAEEYLVDDEPFKKIIQNILENINNTIENTKKDMEKYSNIKLEDINVIITGTKLERENIPEWVETEYFFREFSSEVKEQIKEFVEELWDAGKIYQPRRENQINLDSWGPYLPHSGIFTPEEFESEISAMLSNSQAIVRNLETLKNLFPEKFPANLSAIDVSEKYNSDHETEYREDDLLETFDEVYERTYEVKIERVPEQGEADKILNGNNPISFTTPTSEDKTK